MGNLEKSVVVVQFGPHLVEFIPCMESTRLTSRSSGRKPRLSRGLQGVNSHGKPPAKRGVPLNSTVGHKGERCSYAYNINVLRHPYPDVFLRYG